MPTYIRLVSLTEQGVRKVTNLPQMLSEAKQVFEANGCRLVEAWATLGRYDFVAVIEAPDDLTAAKLSALVGAQGYFRAETLPAVPIEELVRSITGS